MQGKKQTASGLPIRRDDRAEPDDDDSPHSSPRIDVVNVDGPGTGTGVASSSSSDRNDRNDRLDKAPATAPGPRSEVAQGIVSLKQQLARLNEQAMAVEKSLDDQRRERSDALDRLQRATERCIGLETKVSAFEAEIAALKATHDTAIADLTVLRLERDELKALVSDATAVRGENAELHDSLESSMRAAAGLEDELNDVKKRQFQDALKVTDLEAELLALHAKLDRASADLAEARERTARAESEIGAARDEAMQARDDAARAENTIGGARAEAQKARDEAQKARDEADKHEEETHRLRRDLAAAKEDNAKDRATARDRIDLLERALDDARAASLRTEQALETSRENEDTMARQLEAAMGRAADAKERTSKAEASQHALEQNVRRLREAIAKAFAKIGHGADKPPVPTSSPRPSSAPAGSEDEPISLSSDLIDSLPPSAPEPPRRRPSQFPTAAKIPSFRPAAGSIGVATNATSGIVQAGANLGSVAPGVRSSPPTFSTAPATTSSPPMSASAVSSSPSVTVGPSLELDNDWSTGSEAPPSVPPSTSSASTASSASSASSAPSAASASPASKSVPPPASAAPPAASADVTTVGSIPPPTYASVPPQVHAAAHDGPVDDDETAPARPAYDSLSPATRRGGMSSMPPSIVTTISTAPESEASREELLARLVDPSRSASAARELKAHPDWLRSIPPPTLVAALQSVDYDADRPVFDLARQWEREPLCHALIASMRSEPEARLREHAAWLLKHLAAPTSWKAIADLARSDDEGVQLRRWLLEALDRLAAGRHVGWRELGDVVTALARHPDASLRDGVVGILVSLDRSDEKRRILLDILRSDDDEVVLASAVDALAGALPVELDPNLVERLLGHPSPRVQRSVRDLIERAKKAN